MFGDFFSGIWNTIQSGIQGAGQIIQDITGANIFGDPGSAQQAYNSVSQSFGSNYIAAQNAAVAEMGRALANFNASKPHNGAEYQSFENEIQGIATTFATYAQSLNNARAMKGAGDVQRLANQVVADRETERQSLNIPAATGPVTTKGSYYAGNPTVTGGGVMSTTTLAALAIGAYFLLRR